jgi:hypothetical protein
MESEASSFKRETGFYRTLPRSSFCSGQSNEPSPLHQQASGGGEEFVL